MLTFWFEDPCRYDGRGPIVLVLILERENLDRMKQADPFDLQLRNMPGNVHLLRRPLGDLDVIVAYEEDIGRIMKFKRDRDRNGLMCWIERGRKLLPGEPAPPRVVGEA